MRLERFTTVATIRALDSQQAVAAKLNCKFGLGNCVFSQEAIATRLGLELLETYTIAELRDRYSPQSSLSFPMLHVYSVCAIAKST